MKPDQPMKPDEPARPLKLHVRLSALLLVLGVLLMARQMYADDEPGAIPLLLVVVAMGWFLITRLRIRRAMKRGVRRPRG
jgi:hypothetical protein